ncbi:MAG TPA: hypothetical protein DC047_04005 [Blastocatellia bacterium]|nr:hypothetical protein [Blastocatellia bacterium]
MTPSEALAILGLTEGVDESGLKEAHRRLSRASHPDKAGGDTEQQARINDAYDIVMSLISPEKSMTLRTTQSLRRVESALLVERSARQVDAEAKAINRRRRKPLHRFRNISLVVGIAAGLLLLAVDYLSEPLLETASEAVRKTLKLNFGILALTLGGVALWMQMQVQRLENNIEACTEDLLDRRFCAAQLAKILRYKDVGVISEDDFHGSPLSATSENDIYSNLSRAVPSLPLKKFGFSAALSREDFRRLLLPKAVEHRLLEPIEPQPLNSEMAIQYRVLFRPSVFLPQPPSPPEPPKPPSRAEARGEALAGGIMTVILGGIAAYLVLFHRSWWALLPGFFALGPLALFVGGIGDWIAAIRKGTERV